MPNLSDETRERLWEQIEASREHTKKHFAPEADVCLRYYKGDNDQLIGPYDGEDETPDGLLWAWQNEIQSTVTINQANLTFKRPEVDVEILDPHEDYEEYVEEEIAKRRYELSGGWQADQEARLDCLITGVGAVMHGITTGDVDYTYEEDEEQPFQQEAQEQYGGATLDMASQPGVDTASMLEEAEQEPQRVGRVIGESVVSIRVSPYDLIVPFGTRSFNWQDAEFIGREYWLTVEEANRIGKERGWFDKEFTEFQGVSGDTANSEDKYRLNPAMKEGGYPDGQNIVFFREVWYKALYLENGYSEDGRKYPAGKYPVRVTWCSEREEKELECILWPINLRDEWKRRMYPFNLLFFTRVPDSFHGQGLVRAAIPQQRLLNKGLSINLTAADLQARPKYYGRAELLADEKARTAFESRNPGDFIGIPDEANTEPIGMLQTPTASPNTELLIAHSKDGLNSLTGVNEMARGNPTETKRTATEIQQIGALSSVRPAKQEEDWVEYLTRNFNIQAQLAREFGITEEEVHVSLPKGTPLPGEPEMDPETGEPLQPTSDGTPNVITPNLPKKMRVTVVTGSTKQQDKQSKIQSIMAFVQTFAPLGGIRSQANPSVGEFSLKDLAEAMLMAAEITRDPKDLEDVTEYEQLAQQQMQQQMEMEEAQRQHELMLQAQNGNAQSEQGQAQADNQSQQAQQKATLAEQQHQHKMEQMQAQGQQQAAMTALQAALAPKPENGKGKKNG